MTTIEWTDESWNPLRAMRGAEIVKHGWACVRVSAGCKNCYAATFNKRLGTGLDYTVPDLAKVETYVDEKALEKPLHWRSPRKVFVCSMTDLFGEWVGDDDIERVWAIMARSPRHTFQVLTKRPERMARWVRRDRDPLPNVWIGTSVEDQNAADDRIPHLLATPAAVRFLSCEPLIGPVDISAIDTSHESYPGWQTEIGVDWVIIGGESGPRARPMDLAWARDLVAQCRRAGVAPFVKQLGSKPMGTTVEFTKLSGVRADSFSGKWTKAPYPIKESHGRDMAEWPDDLRVREFPRELVPA